MQNLTKKLFIFLFIVFSFGFLSIKPAHAFSTPQKGYLLDFQDAVFQTNEMNLQSFVRETLRAVQATIITEILGCPLCSGGLTITENRGAIVNVALLINTAYQAKPASGVEYLADMGSKIGIAPPAYAQDNGQGLGFRRMHTLLPIWTAFRNIAYSFFVVVFVFMGFAVMFRIKLSPQTAITIETAIPKIIIGILLVTFSYAIVGFMIDIMFLFNNIVIQTFKSLPDVVFVNNLLPNRPVTSDFETLTVMLGVGLPAILSILIFLLVIIALGAGVGALASIATGGVGAVVVGPAIIFGVVIFGLITIVFLIALIRLLWMLIKTYTNIVLSLIFAPFQLMIGVLPGSNATSSWFKNLISNLAVLPALLTMVFIAGYLALYSLTGIPGIGIIFRILAGHQASPGNWATFVDGLSGANASDLGNTTLLVFVSMGILLMTPKVGDLIQGALSGKGGNFGTAIGEALGPIKGPINTGKQIATIPINAAKTAIGNEAAARIFPTGSSTSGPSMGGTGNTP